MQVRATPQMYFFAEVVRGRRPFAGNFFKLSVPEKKKKEGDMSETSDSQTRVLAILS